MLQGKITLAMNELSFLSFLYARDDAFTNGIQPTSKEGEPI